MQVSGKIRTIAYYYIIKNNLYLTIYIYLKINII